MANIFFSGEKESKAEVVKSVTKFIANYCDCVFVAKVVSDDGGHILQVMIEVGKVSMPILEQKPDFPLLELIPKYRGWRSVIMKVPVGYIGTIVDGRDD